MGFFSNFLRKRQGKKKYSETLKSAVQDHEISEAEAQALNQIQTEFGLKPKDVVGAQKKAINSIFEEMALDSKINESEKAKLDRITKHFNTDLAAAGVSQNRLTKAYYLGLIDDGKLPEVRFDSHLLNIVFKSNEVLHWVNAAGQMKIKKKTERINYRGVTASVRIAKGITYRAGSIKVETVTSEYYAKEDTGWLWLTNQRIGFKGPRKHFSMSYDKISAFEINDGLLHIFKDGKETPYLIYLGDYDVTCSILSLILNGSSKEPKRLPG